MRDIGDTGHADDIGRTLQGMRYTPRLGDILLTALVIKQFLDALR